MDVMSHVASATSSSSLQTYRALVGWMNEQEQLQTLLGRLPLPTDDLAALSASAAAYRAAVTSRPAFTPMSPLSAIEGVELLAALSVRPDIHAFVAGVGGRLAMVNLREVLAFQKTIRVDDLDARAAPALEDLSHLLELCFPSSLSLEINYERDDVGFTLTSTNPNFLIVPGQSPLDIGGLSSFPFHLVPNRNYFMVAHYQGRYFIHNGYHRAVGFLRAGRDIVPCVLAEAQHFDQVGWRPGMIDQEQMLGEYPPRLVDFWDDAVSYSILRQARRRVFRLRVDVFDVAA